MMGLVPLLQETPKREINFFSMHVKQGKTCEHTAKRWLSTSQELNRLTPWTWTSCPLNYEKLHFCCLSHPVLSIFMAAWAKTHTHTHTHTHSHVSNHAGNGTATWQVLPPWEGGVYEPWAQMAWVWIPALPLISCVTLSSLLYLSVLLFPHM